VAGGAGVVLVGDRGYPLGRVQTGDGRGHDPRRVAVVRRQVLPVHQQREHRVPGTDLPVVEHDPAVRERALFAGIARGRWEPAGVTGTTFTQPAEG